MKNLRGSLWAKTLAIMLLSLLVLACVGSTLAVSYLYGESAYTYGYDATARELLGQLGNEYSLLAGQNYLLGIYEGAYEDTNFRYTVTSLDGKELYSDYEGDAVLWEDTTRVTRPHETWREDSLGEERGNSPEQWTEIICLLDQTSGELHEFSDQAQVNAWRLDNSILVHGYVLKDLSRQDAFRQRLEWFTTLWSYRNFYPWIAAASFLLGILLFVFLMSAAGHRDETETVTASFVDKIPYDVLTAGLGFGIVMLLFGLGTGFRLDLPSMLICGILLLAAGLLFLLWCMSTAVRLKLGGIWKSCLIYQLLRWCGRVLKAVGYALGKLPLVWKWALGIAALALIDGIWRGASEGDGGMMLFGWLLLWLLLGLAGCYAVLAFRRLRQGAREIVLGNESYTVDTRHLIGDFRDHALDLNNIRAGLNRAVDERMKSERFRTELITNVSHDIKTPLTSIISYVDLLSKEELDNEAARGYLEVLQRQSGRLKKLIDDLMEASKASTGSLPVELTRCELGVMLDQTAGEYGERLQKAGLELVTDKPERPVTVMADGRHLWRIFDNLMNNICKYAQSGTRVYLTLREENGRASVTFRNISREPLRMDAAELTERFVRGDSSRNTEGSGLGLAIAQSLAQLQGATLNISVDGDLFKVVLGFDTVRL